MSYIKTGAAHTNQLTEDLYGNEQTRYSRYETGFIEGEYRDMLALIADETGFDGFGFDVNAGSNDDSWHVVNLFENGGHYIDSVAIGGALDEEHALSLATTQFDYLGADYGVLVGYAEGMQFDHMTDDQAWSIDAISKLLNNPSQDKHYLPIITSKELQTEATRAAFDDVQWDNLTLSSHGGSLTNLYTDMIRADTFKELTQEFDLQQALIDLEAEEAEFDSIMDTVNRLPMLKDRLFRAMSQASNETLSVTNVTQTKPFKRGGVVNVAFVFDLSDGQKLSIWFHNPDSTPSKLLAGDMMVSWKWLLNKRDVTAILSPVNGQTVKIPTLARQMMLLASKNSKNFKRAQERKAKRDADINEAKSNIEQKKQTIEQLDKDIASLKDQIDAAMKANKGKADVDTTTGNALPEPAIKVTSSGIRYEHGIDEENAEFIKVYMNAKNDDHWLVYPKKNGSFNVYSYNSSSRAYGGPNGYGFAKVLNDEVALRGTYKKISDVLDAIEDSKLQAEKDATTRAMAKNGVPVREASEYFNETYFEGDVLNKILVATKSPSGEISNIKVYSSKTMTHVNKYINKVNSDNEKNGTSNEALAISPARYADNLDGAYKLEQLGHKVDYSDPDDFLPSWYVDNQNIVVERQYIYGKDTVNPADKEIFNITQVKQNKGLDEAEFRVATLNGSTSVNITRTQLEEIYNNNGFVVATQDQVDTDIKESTKEEMAVYVNSKGRVVATVYKQYGSYDVVTESSSYTGIKQIPKLVGYLEGVQSYAPSMKLLRGIDYLKGETEASETETQDTSDLTPITSDAVLSRFIDQATKNGWQLDISTLGQDEKELNKTISDTDVLLEVTNEGYNAMTVEGDVLSYGEADSLNNFNETNRKIEADVAAHEQETGAENKVAANDFTAAERIAMARSKINDFVENVVSDRSFIGISDHYAYATEVKDREVGSWTVALVDRPETGKVDHQILYSTKDKDGNAAFGEVWGDDIKEAYQAMIAKDDYYQNPEDAPKAAAAETGKPNYNTTKDLTDAQELTVSYTNTSGKIGAKIVYYFNEDGSENGYKISGEWKAPSRGDNPTGSHAEMLNFEKFIKENRKVKSVSDRVKYFNKGGEKAARFAEIMTSKGWQLEILTINDKVKKLHKRVNGMDLTLEVHDQGFDVSTKDGQEVYFGSQSELSDPDVVNVMIEKAVSDMKDTSATEPASVAEPANTAYSQEDIDFLNTIIAGDFDPDNVDMDKMIEIGEKDENDPLYEQAINIVLEALDEASSNL